MCIKNTNGQVPQGKDSVTLNLMTTASLLHFCSDSLPGPPNDQWSSQQGEGLSSESFTSIDEVWKTSNRTDKIQHSPHEDLNPAGLIELRETKSLSSFPNVR